jgi:hypothetical protein
MFAGRQFCSDAAFATRQGNIFLTTIQYIISYELLYIYINISHQILGAKLKYASVTTTQQT